MHSLRLSLQLCLLFSNDISYVHVVLAAYVGTTQHELSYRYMLLYFFCPFAAPETLRVGTSGGHSISGPLLQEPQTGSMRKNRSTPSILASAFQNAWKQGTMAAEVGVGAVTSFCSREPGMNLSNLEQLCIAHYLPT